MKHRLHACHELLGSLQGSTSQAMPQLGSPQLSQDQQHPPMAWGLEWLGGLGVRRAVGAWLRRAGLAKLPLRSDVPALPASQGPRAAAGAGMHARLACAHLHAAVVLMRTLLMHSRQLS